MILIYVIANDSIGISTVGVEVSDADSIVDHALVVKKFLFLCVDQPFV